MFANCVRKLACFAALWIAVASILSGIAAAQEFQYECLPPIEYTSDDLPRFECIDPGGPFGSLSTGSVIEENSLVDLLSGYNGNQSLKLSWISENGKRINSFTVYPENRILVTTYDEGNKPFLSSGLYEVKNGKIELDTQMLVQEPHPKGAKARVIQNDAGGTCTDHGLPGSVVCKPRPTVIQTENGTDCTGHDIPEECKPQTVCFQITSPTECQDTDGCELFTNMSGLNSVRSGCRAANIANPGSTSAVGSVKEKLESLTDKDLKKLLRSTKKVSAQVKMESGTWTPWLNRDRPGGSGDHDSLTGHVKDGAVCEKPTQIQCRTSSDKVDWTKTGERYHCTVNRGGVCKNDEQPDGMCQDYEVRFNCPAE